MGLELDNPSNMTKKPDIGSYDLKKTEMTFWSRYDPVRNATGPTDHWTKMKLRAKERVGSACPTSANAFERSLHRGFDGMSPGSYHLTRPKTTHGYKSALRTSYNERAREKFQYWIIEKPKPTPSECVPSKFACHTNSLIDPDEQPEHCEHDVTYTNMVLWQ